MAQSRQKRNERRKRVETPSIAASEAARRQADRRRSVRRIVIVLMLLIGLAGVLMITPPGNDSSGDGRTPIDRIGDDGAR